MIGSLCAHSFRKFKVPKFLCQTLSSEFFMSISSDHPFKYSTDTFFFLSTNVYIFFSYSELYCAHLQKGVNVVILRKAIFMIHGSYDIFAVSQYKCVY